MTLFMSRQRYAEITRALTRPEEPHVHWKDSRDGVVHLAGFTMKGLETVCRIRLDVKVDSATEPVSCIECLVDP